MGSQHPSPNVKNPLQLEPERWLEIITLRAAKGAAFKASRCDVQVSGVFLKRCVTGAPDGVATLKVRKGAFDALNKGSRALGKVK